MDDYERMRKSATEFKRVVMKELIEPWAVPCLEWMIKTLRRWQK